jgi:hypothetical protein
MPDLDQIKQGKQGVRDRRARFATGRSGNPANQPRGCRDHQAEIGKCRIVIAKISRSLAVGSITGGLAFVLLTGLW